MVIIKPNIKGATSGIYGHVDFINEEGIGGWILDLDRPDEPQNVELYINGQKCAEAVANIPRPDISQIIGREANCGFLIRWKDVNVEGILGWRGSEIEIIHPPTGRKVDDKKVKFLKTQKESGFLNYYSGLDEKFLSEITKNLDDVRHNTETRENITILKLKDISCYSENDKICVFAHYDRDNIVDDYIIYYLSALNESGFDIVFVTTSGADEVYLEDRLKSKVNIVIKRNNIGRDFYSYKTGIYAIFPILKRYKLLLLANDSVYMFSKQKFSKLIDGVYQKVLRNEGDFFGAIDSYERAYHLQSWFLGFAINKNTYEFLGSLCLVPLENKEDIINIYEVGLSQMAIKSGLRVISMFDYKKIALSLNKGHPYYEHTRKYYANPTHFFWDVLINKGFPFIKKELLAINPSRIVNLDGWKDLLEWQADDRSVVDLIINNLNRIKGES